MLRKIFTRLCFKMTNSQTGSQHVRLSDRARDLFDNNKAFGYKIIKAINENSKAVQMGEKIKVEYEGKSIEISSATNPK